MTIRLSRARNPDAVRPWQHVLNPLSGYLLLAQELFRGAGPSRAWNFGPAAEDERTVGWIVQRLAELWQGELAWEIDEGENPAEAAHLALDSTLAGRELGWRPAWDLEAALARLVDWHRAQLRGERMRAVTIGQIERFVAEIPAA